MSEEEKRKLLLMDLGMRLGYGVYLKISGGEFDAYQYPYLLTAISKFGGESLCKVYNSIYTPFGCPKIEDVKPYLRSMSSMTKEEEKEFEELFIGYSISRDRNCVYHSTRGDLSLGIIDWLNKKGFDYRGLIPMGLALEAKEGMYNK